METPGETEAETGKRRIWPTWGCTTLVVILLLLLAGGIGSYVIELRRLERARRADAEATAMAVYNAIDEYRTDFGRLPEPTSSVKGKDVDSDTSAAEGLIMILMGMDETKNPRKTNYLGDIREAQTKSGKRVNGIIEANNTLELVDYWGEYYHVRMDTSGDGFIDDPSDPGTPLKKTFIVWSSGKDNDPATWKDNVASWKSGP